MSLFSRHDGMSWPPSGLRTVAFLLVLLQRGRRSLTSIVFSRARNQSMCLQEMHAGLVFPPCYSSVFFPPRVAKLDQLQDVRVIRDPNYGLIYLFIVFSCNVLCLQPVTGVKKMPISSLNLLSFLFITIYNASVQVFLAFTLFCLLANVRTL